MNRTLIMIILLSGVGLVYFLVNYLKDKDPFDIFVVSFIIICCLFLSGAAIRLKNEVKHHG